MPFDDQSPSAQLEREALDWLVKLTSGAATQDDAEALRRWRGRSPAHEQAFVHVARLWKSSGGAAALQPMGALPAAQRPMVSRRAFLGGGAAASAAGAVGLGYHFALWPSYAEFMADMRTTAGQQRKVTLPDGSVAELNTRTSLNLAYAGNTRGVSLVAGEAAFSVVSDAQRPFEVAAGDGHISASSQQAGQEFVVRNNGGDVTVTCVSGAVTVECGGKAVLRPSDQIAYRGGKLGQMAQINPELIAAWRRGVLVFRDEALGDIVDEINRYRPGRVMVLRPGLSQQRLSGVFHLGRLDEAIAHVETTLDARAQRVAGGIVLIY